MPKVTFPVLRKCAGELCFLTLLGLISLAAGLLLDAVRRDRLPLSFIAQAELSVPGAPGAATANPLASPHFSGTQVKVVELQEMLAQGRALLIDARAPLFFRHGHLPGAISIPRNDFPEAYARARATIDANAGKLLVVYCQGGACEDSIHVAEALRNLGHANVAIFPGGWNEWQVRGFATTHDGLH